MCISVWYTFPDTSSPFNLKFILLFNRDELFNRPTSFLDYINEFSDSDANKKNPKIVICGRDYYEKNVAKGTNGSWLAVDLVSKKVSFLTNVLLDDPVGKLISPASKSSSNKNDTNKLKSRGQLVLNAVKSDGFSDDHLFSIDCTEYSPSHLMLTKENHEILRLANNSISEYPTGHCHAISNSGTGKIWQKQKLAEKLLNSAILSSTGSTDHPSFIQKCFNILENTDGIKIPDDEVLEKFHVTKNSASTSSSATDPKYKIAQNYVQIFQNHESDLLKDIYGTRSSTIVQVFKNNKIQIIERTKKLQSNFNLENEPKMENLKSSFFKNTKVEDLIIGKGPFENGLERWITVEF